MIKCPKCDFEQPEDIYCAQCGVNMKNFVPPRKSIVALLLSNQNPILGILFVGIIIFVLYDYALSKKPRTNVVAAITKQTSEQMDVQDSQTPSSYKPAIEPGIESPQAQPIEAASTEKVAVEAPRPARVANDPPAQGATVAKSSLQISFYQVSRALLSEIQRETNASPFNGDGFGGIVSKKRLAVLRKSPELKSISTNRYKLDGLPISIFKGQKSGESAKSIGLYFQVNPLKNDATSFHIEVKSWGSLKLQENDENLFTSEMTLNSQSVAMIAGFLPKDKVFGDEEKSIFETDRALKIYNSEGFWDGDIDLIMFVELPD